MNYENTFNSYELAQKLGKAHFAIKRVIERSGHPYTKVYSPKPFRTTKFNNEDYVITGELCQLLFGSQLEAMLEVSKRNVILEPIKKVFGIVLFKPNLGTA